MKAETTVIKNPEKGKHHWNKATVRQTTQKQNVGVDYVYKVHIRTTLHTLRQNTIANITPIINQQQ